MKNKRLITVIALILIYLTGTFIYETVKEPSRPSSTNEKEKTVVGVLQFVSHPALDEIYRGIKDGLKESGLEEGRNLEINFQNGQADQSKLATMSQQLVQQDPDVLIGIATPAAQALANTTSSIPLVLGAVTDPVGAELVQSMNKPGGDITGVSDQPPIEAQIKLATEILPEAKKVGILYASSEDNSRYQVTQAEEAAKKAGLTSVKYAVPSTNEIAQTVQVMSQAVDFIYVPLDNTIANAMQTVVKEANKAQIPVIPSVDTMVEQGGLATIGINQYDLGVQTGKMAASLANGKEPASTPVYVFDEGTVIINEEQAALLGITIPDKIKEEATMVTETKEEEE
ncbi:ABC transporter substrate-binding protein [Enterococcus sp. 10A9_DIV0425]|uniref:ABC transporter substrate-binding protein n=1 Tax=Candidatus Enterococcus wittei TaxID=1987383 RepID=A0A2C9XNS0_9ENTE|nr:tryptophan ABC transporter substrate-binding protein [Enterococcus sp. 10A9_DIV0425]OTP11801.1 ABC transporter substrate-binding protein [Enterococcus sp. 10A9_DIV0425]